MPVLAKFLSIVFHPIFAVIYAYTIVFFAGSYHSYLPIQIKQFVLLIVLINTVIIPIVLIILLKYAGIIRHIELNDRKDRVIAISIMVVAYAFTLYMFRSLGLPFVLLKLILGGVVAMVITVIISFWWKVSCHSTGIGGLTGFLYSSALTGLIPFNWLLLVSIVLSGLILSARLGLGAHTPKQVYIGYAVGFIVLLFTV